MRTLFLLLLTFTFILGISNAQVSFSDDFESYNVGDFIDESSTDWKTWTNRPGSNNDGQVTDERAASGTKSLNIYGSNGNSGGPMDILLPFKGTYTEGRFVQSMNLYIEEGKNAHFNYQANPTQGQKWALYGFFRENGLIEITNDQNELVFSTPFPNDQWFNFELDINLTSNVWKVKLNQACVGSFKNTVNKISSVSFYTINDRTDFFMDDVAFAHDENIADISNDVGIVNMQYNGGKLVGITNNISLELGNFGIDTITQIELSLDNNGNSITEEITGIKLSPGETMMYNTEAELTLTEGKNQISVSLDKINDQLGDDNDCNNISITQVEPIKPALYKGVIIEEGTGTWCPWCVRGTVFMDRLSNAYDGYFIPIAVHNNDPMVVIEYDNFVKNFPNFTGFPNAVIARQEATGFGVIEDMEDPFIEEVQRAAPLFASAGVEYDANTREMKISAFVTFLWDRENDYHLNLAITEDGVTGTSSGYAQANAYAGGAQGPMGGYENLPTPVPAESMVYDHVARAIFGLNKTEATTIKGPFVEGQTVKVDFVYTVPQGQNVDNMYIIPIVLKDGAFVNAREVHFNDAIARGIVSSEFESPANMSVKIFPNPTSNITYLNFQLDNQSMVSVQISDLSGKMVASTNFGKLSGDIQLPLDVSILENGIYVAKIITEEGSQLKKIIVNK